MKTFGRHWILTLAAIALVIMSALTVGFCVFTFESALWPAVLAGLLGFWMAWEANKKISEAREAWDEYLKGGR